MAFTEYYIVHSVESDGTPLPEDSSPPDFFRYDEEKRELQIRLSDGTWQESIVMLSLGAHVLDELQSGAAVRLLPEEEVERRFSQAERDSPGDLAPFRVRP